MSQNGGWQASLFTPLDPPLGIHLRGEVPGPVGKVTRKIVRS